MKKTKTIVIRLDDDLHKFLQNLASDNRSNISYEIRKLVLEKFNVK
jgi:predicted transcriptional regulator